MTAFKNLASCIDAKTILSDMSVSVMLFRKIKVVFLEKKNFSVSH